VRFQSRFSGALAGGYYKIDEPRTQQLLDKLILKYRENLNYYGKLVPSRTN
jgi:hypothetical protein